MKPQDKIAIDNMRMQGLKPGEIALRLKLSPNTVRSHIRRHPEIPGTTQCPACRKPIAVTNGHRKKKYCSDKCRMNWWNSHPDIVNRKAYYTLTCKYCGKEFESYGNKNRKYCCRECYRRSHQSIRAG